MSKRGVSHITSAAVLAESAKNVGLDEFVNLVKKVTNQLISETGTLGNLTITGKLVDIPANGEAIVVGDLHGDLNSLIHILEESNFLTKTKKTKNIWLIFLGDYGDRGVQSPEVYYVVLTLKESFPENVILLRGNHEGPPDLRVSPHDMPTILENKFGQNGSKAYSVIRLLFDQLYTAARVQDRIVLVHGGAPSQAKRVEDIAYAHQTHPKKRELEEILWSDPQPNLKGTISSPRGLGKLFGSDVTRKFLRLLNVEALIRSHQFCPNGYQTIHRGTVLTIFSTKYSYHDNFGAYLELDLSKNNETPKHLLQSIRRF